MIAPANIRLLRAAGLDDDGISGVAGEIGRILSNGIPNSLTFDDIQAEAVFTVLKVYRRKPDATNAYVCVSTRHKIFTLIKNENREFFRYNDLPIERNGTGWPFRTRIMRLPLVDRECGDCGIYMAQINPSRYYCDDCSKARRREKRKGYDKKRRTKACVSDPVTQGSKYETGRGETA